jgi:hypothetical protein
MTCGRSNREKPAAESCLAAGRGGEGSSAEPVRPGGGADRSKRVSSLFSTTVRVCEVCGRAVEWPNGKPTLVRREQEQRL